MSTFSFKRQVYFKDTDAAGVVYFSNFFNFAHEAFEQYLQQSAIAIAGVLKNGQELWPVTYSDCRYFAAVQLHDELLIEGKIEIKDESRIRCIYEVILAQKKKVAAVVHIEHTFISAQERKKIPIPESIVRLL